MIINHEDDGLNNDAVQIVIPTQLRAVSMRFQYLNDHHDAANHDCFAKQPFR